MRKSFYPLVFDALGADLAVYGVAACEITDTYDEFSIRRLTREWDYD